MCAVTSIVNRSVRSIVSIDGRYGGCWHRYSPKPPSHKPRRRLNSSSTPGPVEIARVRCGGKRYPGCLSVPLPPKSPGFHPRHAPPNCPVPHRQIRRCSGKAHSRACTAAAAALARSIARAVCGGCGGGGRRLHRPSRALRAPCVTRMYAYVITAHRARHRRFPFPPCTTGTRALQRRRRSLARSIAWCGGGDGGLAVGHAARHTHHSIRVSRARTCASSTGDTRVITVSFPPHARMPALQRKRRLLAPSIARAWCGGKRHPGCLSVPLPPKSPDSPFLTIPSKPSRSSSPGTTMLGQSPLTRAHCGGGGARSLGARSRARCVAVAVEVTGGYAVTSPVTRVATAPRITRVYEYVITAHRTRHRRFLFPPCTTGTRALQWRRRSLAPSIARARCGGGDGGCGRSRHT